MSSHSKPPKPPIAPLLLASSGAGIFADTLCHPIETVKARLQTQRLFKFKKGFQKFSSPLDAIVKTYSREGMKGFFRGYGAVLPLTPIGHSIYFTSYELVKGSIQAQFNTKEETMLIHFASGMLANFLAASCCFVPMDVVKQRCIVQQVQKDSGKKVSALRMARNIVASEGIRGLYRGYLPALLCFSPYVAFFFMFYEESKRRAAQFMHRDVSQLHFYTYLLCSGVSGATAGFITNPLDTLKTRIQVQSKDPNSKPYKSIFDGFQTILRKEGPKAFFAGATARAVWLGSGSALSMMFFETAKNYLLESPVKDGGEGL